MQFDIYHNIYHVWEIVKLDLTEITKKEPEMKRISLLLTVLTLVMLFGCSRSDISTMKIADQIDLKLDYNDFLFPKIDIPEGYANSKEYLKVLRIHLSRAMKVSDNLTNLLKLALLKT